MLFLSALDFMKWVHKDRIGEVASAFGGKSIFGSYVLAPGAAMLLRADQWLCSFMGWRLFDRITEFSYVLSMVLWLDRVHVASKDHQIQVASKWQAALCKLSFGVNACHGFLLAFLNGFYNLMDHQVTLFSFASFCFGTIFWSFAVSLVTYLLVEHPVGTFYSALVVGQRVGQASKSRQKSDATYDPMVQARVLRRTRSEVD